MKDFIFKARRGKARQGKARRGSYHSLKNGL